MDFNFTEDQKLIRDMVREFAEKELTELAAEIDEKREFPANIVKKMGELGLLGLAIPEKYSGGEMDIPSVIIAIEQIAKVCASTAVIFAAHNLIVSRAIAKFGTQEQRKKYLPELASGKCLAGIALKEPDSLSSVIDMEIVAVDDGNSWILNGIKRLVIGADEIDIFMFMAKDNDDKPLIFLLSRDEAGMKLDSDESTLGLNALKCKKATFENCRIAKENILGDEARQIEFFGEIQDMGKLAISAVGIGIAQTALKLSIEHSMQRRQFDKYIAEFDGLRWMMASMESDIVSARHNLYVAASAKDEGNSAEKECAIAKLSVAKTAVKAAIDAIQIRGGYGYMREYPLERMFRDAKATEFIMGGIQTQMEIIAEKILGN